MGRSGELALLVLAAGRGSRMRSELPKVLHPVCGRPILMHALKLGGDLKAARQIVVIGPSLAEVRAALPPGVEVVEQPEPRGTGDAVLQARDLLQGHAGPVLIMYGDHPLYRASTLQTLVDLYTSSQADLAILTCRFPDPTGYGRIVRDAGGRVERIIEEADASSEVRALDEVNLGVYILKASLLFDTLGRANSDNAQGELYLTDIVEIALEAGCQVETHCAEDWEESIGVNDRADLANAERILRRRIADHWMRAGVTLIDAEHTYIDVDVEIGPDSILEPGCRLRGSTRIGASCRIDPHVVIDGSTVGDGVWLKPHSWLEDCKIGDGCIIGPSAHIRPNSELARDVRIGNFVEVKNSTLGAGTKADHLSYIGDADLGLGVTFACGAITVNYDGVKKSRTRIGDGTFVGCNSNLIAPVTLAPGSYVAAGSTITKEVPADALAVGRARQRNIEGWVKRKLGGKSKD